MTNLYSEVYLDVFTRWNRIARALAALDIEAIRDTITPVANGYAVVDVDAVTRTRLAGVLGQLDDIARAEGWTDLKPLGAEPAPRVPDQSCPKCGEPSTTIRYRSGRHLYDGGRWCPADSSEHFDRSCSRCGHQWATTDVLTTERQP